jgi:hypothetical protein
MTYGSEREDASDVWNGGNLNGRGDETYHGAPEYDIQEKCNGAQGQLPPGYSVPGSNGDRLVFLFKGQLVRAATTTIRCSHLV